MKVIPIKTELFAVNQNLYAFIDKYIENWSENMILVVTSKIVALAEGRVEEFTSEEAKEELIKAESEVAIKTKYCWLTVKDDVVMASAGIDESNANGKLILLPKDSFLAADKIRNHLKEKYHLKNVGVMLTDSRTIPLRAGVTGVAVGYAGFKGIKSYIGTPDLFGRIMEMSRTNIADCLASAAILEMGEGTEMCPLAIIDGAPVEFVDTIDRGELRIDYKDDLYKPMFTKDFDIDEEEDEQEEK